MGAGKVLMNNRDYGTAGSFSLTKADERQCHLSSPGSSLVWFRRVWEGGINKYGGLLIVHILTMLTFFFWLWFVVIWMDKWLASWAMVHGAEMPFIYFSGILSILWSDGWFIYSRRGVMCGWRVDRVAYGLSDRDSSSFFSGIYLIGWSMSIYQ